MGWKAATVFANNGGDGYLGTLPPHRPAIARQAIRHLGLHFSSATATTFLDNGIWSPHGTFAVGAYERAMIISEPKRLGGVWPGERNPLMDRILAYFPHSNVLAISLQSAADHWGYTLWESGVRKRCFMGDSTSGILFDEGELQPQEERIFQNSRSQSTERRTFFDPAIGEEYPEYAAGERLVFAMSERFFGTLIDRLSDVDLFKLQMELFRS